MGVQRLLEKAIINVESEVRFNTDGRKIYGHAAVFNSLSVPMYGFREIIRPGAFQRSLKSMEFKALWNHNTDLVLGSKAAGTVRAFEDSRGLAVEIDPPEEAALYIASIKRGDVTKMSFGFSVTKDGEKTQRTSDGIIRELLDVDLFDVSPTPFPAYESTDVHVRAFYDQIVKEAIQENDGAAGVLDSALLADFLARAKERQDFIARRTPAPDPLSFDEIIKNARIKE